MKVAICFSGFLRNYKECYPTFNKYVLQANPGIDFSIFLHTWEKFDTSDFRPWNVGAGQRIAKLETAQFLDDVRSKYGEVFTEPVREFAYSQAVQKQIPRSRNKSHQGPISMFYGIKRAIELASGDFDLVVRVRPDCWFRSPVKLDAVDPGKVVVPLWGNFGGLNDQFALGSQAAMKIYSGVYDHIDELMELGCLYQPEMMLKAHLFNYGLDVEKRDINFALKRVDGSFQDNKLLEQQYLQNKTISEYVPDFTPRYSWKTES
jgi:hypothetical protein